MSPHVCAAIRASGDYQLCADVLRLGEENGGVGEWEEE